MAKVIPLLTDGDKQSALWQKLKRHVEAQLESYRKQNDGDLSPEKTQRLRGRIAQCNSFLALEIPMPTTDDN